MIRASLRSWIDGRLSRGLAIRLLLVLLVALAALSLAVVLVTERARSSAAQRDADEIANVLDQRFRALQSGWLSQADVLLAQINFARVLDLPDAVQRNAALSAYFATLGGEGTFTHAVLADARDGRVLWRHRTRSQQDLVLPAGAQTLAWAFGESDATLYRAIAQRVLVAGQPARLWLYVPLDRGLVAANVSSGTEVDLRWQGRELIQHRAMRASEAAWVARPEAPMRVLRWAGDEAGPEIAVRNHAQVPMDVGQALGIAALAGAVVALMGWLVLVRWLNRHAAHLSRLQAATQGFKVAMQVTGAVRAALDTVGRDAGVEMKGLAADMRTMMLGLEASQRELNEQRNRFKQYLHVAQSILVALDGDARITLLNRKGHEVLGYGDGELLGRDWFSVCLPPEDYEQLKSVYRQLMAGEKQSFGYYENSVITRSGERRLIAWRNSLVLDADGRVCGTLSSGEDITDRVRAEADLHENTVKLRALYELSPLGIALTDMSGRYIEFNEAFRKICGYSAEELRALDYWALTPRQYEAEEARQLDSLKSTGRYGPYEKAYLRKGGDLVPLQLSGVLITGQNGQSFIWSIVEDITERQLAKQALLELNVSLESRVTERTRELQATLESLRQAQDELVRSEKMASLGALVAGVAHELNTPIGNAMLVASTLEGRQREFEAAISGGLRRSSLDAFLSGLREASAVVERNLQRAADLIGSFKQVAVDQSSYQRREFDLAEVVQEISLALSPTLKRSGVKVLEHVPAGMRMDSHPGPLGQVLINLISNAATHAFEEGQMGSVRIAAEATGEGRVSLIVSDDGRGIPQHNLKRIFDPFFTTRLGQGGSGLGLHITYTLVTGLLGGRIEVRSEPGHGTAFTIQLPLVAPHGGTASNLMASDYHSTQL